MSDKKSTNILLELKKPRHPNYSLSIFTGVITIIMFQVIMYNSMRGITATLGERIATLACLGIFIIFSWINFSDENHNNRSVL